MDYQSALKLLKQYNQLHILNFYDQLSITEQKELLNQVFNIDFNLMDKLYKKTIISDESTIDEITPMDVIDKEKLSNVEREHAISVGEECIKNGEFAYVTMAGGQGTRLGHIGPKGTFVLDLDNNKSLFELLCDSLKVAREKYGVTIPWYIMTSRENNNDTILFFEENNYFDYGKENIKFFMQRELPMIHEDGKLVMESIGKIKEAADGHGGVFNAMVQNNIIKDMKIKGINWVFISGVDNCLVKMLDPLLIGLSKINNVKLASKTITKSYPEEKVGVFCKRNNRPSVIEYTEITQDMANLRDEEGELVYGQAHILCNLFNIDVIEKMQKKPLDYHIAHKATDFIDEKGRSVSSANPNSYKFETFIFDAFAVTENMLLLKIKREEEFAPVKNKEGVDSPETARRLLKEMRK